MDLVAALPHWFLFWVFVTQEMTLTGKPIGVGGKKLHPKRLEQLGGGSGRGNAVVSWAAGGRSMALFGLFWKQLFEAVRVTVDGFVGMCHESVKQLQLSVGHCIGTGRMPENWQLPLEQIPR